jgi:hypothetical protein
MYWPKETGPNSQIPKGSDRCLTWRQARERLVLARKADGRIMGVYGTVRSGVHLR